ncbi:MAG TPA: DUF6491 family protein [Rudaea sp.]|nr:DUF6491 family protein [Rudaea sp.]
MRNELVPNLMSIFAGAIFLAVVSMPSFADTREHQADELARFKQYAGAPVGDFPMVDIFQTQIVGDWTVVVWPTINSAYLITVDKSCSNLEWAKGFTVTQKMSMKVTKTFDFITFDRQRCKITEIRPVDYKAMLKDDKAKRSAAQGGGT